jgi:hypothetical protein
MTTPEDHHMRGTAVAALAGACFVSLSLWAAGGLLLIGAMTCDEVCEGEVPPPGADWERYSDAWQWGALSMLACAIALFAIVATGLVLYGRRNIAAPLVAANAVAAIAATAIQHDGVFGAAAIIASVIGVAMALVPHRSLPKRRPVAENPNAS